MMEGWNKRSEAGEDRHQRRLAGAVAADQRMGLAGQDADVGVAQGDGRAVALGDADRLDDRRRGRRPVRAAAIGLRRRLELVAPEALVVDVFLGDQGRRQLVLEHAGGDLDDGAVVVGRARLERLARDRLLQVHEPYLA